MFIKEKLKDKSGILLPLAIVLMLMSTAMLAYAGSFIGDRLSLNRDKGLVSIAQREAENALVYGVYGSNTQKADGGHKCGNDDWYSTLYEITNEDGGVKSTAQGYTVKRYIKFANNSAIDTPKDATLQGIARIYNTENVLMAEKVVEMHVNLLYYGGTKDADNPCSADAVEMFKETWRTVR